MTLVVESTQDHAAIRFTNTSPTLTASMGLGGGMIPMVVIERRMDTEVDCEQSNLHGKAVL